MADVSKKVLLSVEGEDHSTLALSSAKSNVEELSTGISQVNTNFKAMEANALWWISMITSILIGFKDDIIGWFKDSPLGNIQSEIAQLKNMVGEIKTMLEGLNSTWGRIYDETIGKYLKNLEAAVGKIKDIKGQIDNWKDSWKDVIDIGDFSELNKELDKAYKELEHLLGVSIPSVMEKSETGIIKSLSSIEDGIKGLDPMLDKSVSLDNASALAAAGDVMAAIAAIPDVSYKQVIVQYMTQASPVRPFSEGMEYIKQKMQSLPSESAHIVKYEGHDGQSQPSGAMSQSIAFSPVINISSAASTGRAMAEELEAAMADRWRYNRSELRRAIQGA